MKKEKDSKHFTDKDVESIAWLAKIELSEGEKSLFARQLSSIIEYFRILDEADTEGIPPTSNVLDLTNVFRKDVVETSLSTEEALTNAPMKEGGFFKAPKIV